jgi:superfamily I DNA/RNA helicase
VICDEHQDSSGDQHAIVMSLLGQGAFIRVFGDPMQRIYGEEAVAGSSPACGWALLKEQADVFEQLDIPHR